MRRLFFIIIISCGILMGCDPKQNDSSLENSNKKSGVKHNDWNQRKYDINDANNLEEGHTYLAVYSEIYARKESRTYPLTITVSIRNTSLRDSVFIKKSEYYDTHGNLINTYFDHTIYVAPLETVEIIVEEDHEKGGAGGNFIFHWASKNKEIKPLFEAVMISANGQQGISFTTQGIDLQNY